MLRPLILLIASVFLLGPAGGAEAQVTVTGPPSPTTRALTTWFTGHIPAKFQARERVNVQPLPDADMDEYLHDGDEGSHSEDDDDDTIDGVFVNHPPRILLRIPDSGAPDFYTFAHEYGHYLWFDVLTKDDRKRYTALYDKQKAAHKLITDYAADSVEEGFAEAFAAEVNAPATLLHRDPLSARFLLDWPKER